MTELVGAELGRLSPTARAELAAILTELVDGARTVLQGNFLGAYLIGSFAQGGGDRDSDVDFLMVTRSSLDPAQMEGLRRLHARLPDSPIPWAAHLEGSYVPSPELRAAPAMSAPWWYVDNGSRELAASSHDDTAVARWVLREHGFTLAGPDPRTLLDPITAGQLREESAASLRAWRASLLSDPAALENAWLQQHVVLACCRARYTAATGSVTTKLAAGRWAVEAMSPGWASLIQRAIDDRPDPWGRVHRTADPDLVAATRADLRAI